MRFFRMNVLSVVILSLVLLVGGCDSSVSQPPSVARGGLIGQQAPELTLTDMQGQPVSLAQFRGQVVILNFWATWCPPCREEMPSMERLYQDNRDKGLVMLAVNVEANGQQAVSQFLQRHPYSFPVLLDNEATAQKAYGVFRFPESFIIDRNGVVVEKIVGGRNWLSGPTFKLVDFLLNG